MNFNLKSEFNPTGDQPNAIKQLVTDIQSNMTHNVLHGATGTGKTFTMANVIQQVNKPTLILSHNKTLAAQLYSEFKNFFPDNLIEYWISDFDYYQPEAYMPTSNKYIAKDSLKNDAITRLRLSTISALKSNRKDIIVIASVSCIFGAGNPDIFEKNILHINVGDVIHQREFLRQLSRIHYSRDFDAFKNAKFRVIGDQVDIYSPHNDTGFRIIFWGDEIEELYIINPKTGKTISKETALKIYPADMHMLMQDNADNVINQIKTDLSGQIALFEKEGQLEEATRIKERTLFDIEMIQEIGYCQGIENYSRYIDGREPGVPPYCLLNYFPDDYLMFIDESHATLPQIKAMYGSNLSMKKNLVEYGFRLPAAFDNRPLKFEEFENLINQVVYVSATPSDYELQKVEGYIVEQLIRPTGLLDPSIEIKPTLNQIDYFLESIDNIVKKNERVLVTTLTKRMAEELSTFLNERINIKSCYLHSEVKTIDRIKILEKLQTGEIDVLVGVNLLREGLDLPQVSLVVIFDADKEGFLRSTRSIIQTMGRAARNINGHVIMFADKITNSMQNAINETDRRRGAQQKHNIKYNITPTTIQHNIEKVLLRKTNIDIKIDEFPILEEYNDKDLKLLIKSTTKEMELAAKDLDFINAAKLRDRLFELKNKLSSL